MFDTETETDPDAQFSAELKSETLKGLVNIISALVDEVKFTLTPEGMTLKAVDAAHVAMIEMKVEKEAFIRYHAEDCEIGIDLDKLKSVLRLASGVDVIRMEQDAEKGKLIFKVGNITRAMTVLDTSGMSDPKVPDLHLKASIGISSDELKRGISAADTISDHVSVKATPERFILSCEGDTDSVSLSVGKESLAELSTDTEVCSLFPLDYFSNIIKAVPGGTVIHIELDNDYPMKLLFSIADRHVLVNYLLAPRIESD
ncbi:MAG: DNA polymerase sliding clamp [Candidatus Methanomethylophilaceae archaeon]|nr:DNA polymerase sliding clamp [Candidatus Methanomethylophilaceae archaeon]